MRSLRPLIPSERSSLESDLRKTKDAAEWKRLFVILGYDEGQSVDELAFLTRISKWTVEEYLKQYSSQNKTKNDPRGGSSSKLDETEASELEEHLFPHYFEPPSFQLAPFFAPSQDHYSGFN